jgi:hypothetical protein
MKKTIILLVVLAIFATSAFAAPVSGMDSFNTIQPDKTEGSGDQTETALESFSAVNESETLFADVRAVALTDTQASEIEGDGLFGAIFGAACGAVVGTIATSGSGVGAVAGAIAGGIMGVCFPF